MTWNSTAEAKYCRTSCEKHQGLSVGVEEEILNEAHLHPVRPSAWRAAATSRRPMRVLMDNRYMMGLGLNGMQGILDGKYQLIHD